MPMMTKVKQNKFKGKLKQEKEKKEGKSPFSHLEIEWVGIDDKNLDFE